MEFCHLAHFLPFPGTPGNIGKTKKKSHHIVYLEVTFTEKHSIVEISSTTCRICIKNQFLARNPGILEIHFRMANFRNPFVSFLAIGIFFIPSPGWHVRPWERLASLARLFIFPVILTFPCTYWLSSLLSLDPFWTCPHQTCPDLNRQNSRNSELPSLLSAWHLLVFTFHLGTSLNGTAHGSAAQSSLGLNVVYQCT